jgi:hypothetical protein
MEHTPGSGDRGHWRIHENKLRNLSVTRKAGNEYVLLQHVEKSFKRAVMKYRSSLIITEPLSYCVYYSCSLLRYSASNQVHRYSSEKCWPYRKWSEVKWCTANSETNITITAYVDRRCLENHASIISNDNHCINICFLSMKVQISIVIC